MTVLVGTGAINLRTAGALVARLGPVSNYVKQLLITYFLTIGCTRVGEI